MGKFENIPVTDHQPGLAAVDADVFAGDDDET